MKSGESRRSGRVVAILQARVGSSRLPGKVLEEIAGRPMCLLVARRVARARRVDEVVIATTTAPADDPVAALCERHGVPCTRGSEHDVLDRYLRAAIAHAADVVVRVTCDCPLIDPAVVDAMLAAFAEGGHDYVSNALLRTYPHGQEVEVFSFAALERAAREATRPSQREHVTSYMLATPGFRLRNVEHEPDLSGGHHRWTVDEPADLAYVRALVERLPDDFSMPDVLDLLDREPGLRRLEGRSGTLAGYYPSIYAEAEAAPPSTGFELVDLDGRVDRHSHAADETNRRLREAFEGLVACAGLANRVLLGPDPDRRIVLRDDAGREDESALGRFLELLAERGIRTRGGWHASAEHDAPTFERVLAGLASALKAFTVVASFRDAPRPAPAAVVDRVSGATRRR